MHLIYGGAALTIVAASGNNSHSGLSGVGHSSRPIPKRFHLRDQCYAALQNPLDEVATSKWSIRGWTYQKGVLSHRRLIFTKSQAILQCNQRQYAESLEPTYTDCLFGTATSIFTHVVSEDDYACFLLDPYFKGQLSHESDTIKAYLGVLEFTLRSRPGYRAAHLYRIPFLDGGSDGPPGCIDWFIRNLTWRVTWDHDESHQTRRSRAFPSWSWASLKANLTPPITVDIEFDRPFRSGEQVLYRDPEIDIHCFDSQYHRYSISETVTSATPPSPPCSNDRHLQLGC